jgi:hypothetical protein
LNLNDHVGLEVRVDLATGMQKCRYVNSSGESVSVYNPFAEGPAQTEFVLKLK